MTTEAKAFQIAQQNANKHNHTRIVYRDEFVGADPGKDYFETEAETFYSDDDYEHCDPIDEVYPDDSDPDPTEPNDSYIPYSDWDLEHLQKEKLTIQESIKHGNTKLKTTLKDINAAIELLGG